MGAGQSSSSGSAATASAEVKTSYYELLGVERSATEDEYVYVHSSGRGRCTDIRPRIKKAYRRKALELHPDRNFGDVERTTALFAEIQAAHEVLSDPQERAWYDAHEGDILRGGAGEGGGENHYEHNMRVTTADDIARMLGKFRGNVEFTDAPNGFFGFVRETFEQLKKEEEAAADWKDVDVPNYPSFGHKDDTYEDVVREFYAAWSGFSTAKTFAWKDLYRVSEAPDRRVRRLMEKENQKSRDAARAEFNDAVRALLLFVRKRDPRYTPNTQSADDRAKAQRAATKQQAARAKAAREAQIAAGVVPEWATRRDQDEEEEEEEEEIEEEHYECVACHKTFKSEKQYDAHERSKKHQKAVYALKRKMQKDNVHLHLDEDVTNSDVITPVEGDDEDSEDVEDANGLGSSYVDVADGVEDLAANEEGYQVLQSEDEDEEEEEEEEDNKPTAKSEQPPSPETESSEDDSNDEYASRSDIEARLSGFRISASNEPSTGNTAPELDVESKTITPAVPKLGKAAQKRAKRAAKQAEIDQSEPQHKCTVCSEAFPSKNQLFQHLQAKGHAAPVSKTKGGSGGGGAGGKKKERRRQEQGLQAAMAAFDEIA